MNKLIAVLMLSSALFATAADTTSTVTTTATTSSVTTSPGNSGGAGNSGNSNASAKAVTMKASLRSKCLTTVAQLLNANLKACRTIASNPRFSNCKQEANNIAKLERGACPTTASALK